MTVQAKFQQGDGIEVRGTFYDINDNLYNPEDVWLTYTMPSGTKTTVKWSLGDITRESLGIYTYNLDTRAESGCWSITMYSEDSDVSKLVAARASINIEKVDGVSV